MRVILGRPVISTRETESVTLDLGPGVLELGLDGALVERPNDRYAALVSDDGGAGDETPGIRLI